MARLVEREIQLLLDVPTDLEASLDWERVGHLLRNLIDNAVRHTPQGGEIRVAAQEDGGMLQLTVFNTGAPIPERDLPNLFVPFYRGRGKQMAQGADWAWRWPTGMPPRTRSAVTHYGG